MKKLYTAKSIYRHDDEAVDGHISHLFEERMVIVEADSFDDAIRQAEIEAKRYAAQFMNVRFAGYIDIFELATGDLRPGLEFYSLIRRSDLGVDEYIDRFYDTGKECEREVIEKPVQMSPPPTIEPPGW
jgi:hypothetical protein